MANTGVFSGFGVGQGPNGCWNITGGFRYSVVWVVTVTSNGALKRTVLCGFSCCSPLPASCVHRLLIFKTATGFSLI